MRKPIVQDVEVQFRLLQVEPGQEDGLADRLTEAGILHWYGLGKYDIVCISTDSALESPSILSWEDMRRHVWEWMPWTAFAWAGEGGDVMETIRSASADHHWMALVMAKLHEGALHAESRSPIENQRRISHQVEGCLDEQVSRALVLGGLGWHELKILAWDNDVTRLSSAIADLDKVGLSGGQSRCAITKTFTTFALRYDFFRFNDDPRWQRLDDDTTPGIRAEARLAFSRLATERPAKAAAADTLGFPHRAEWVYGPEDMLVTPREDVSLGTVLKGVISLRKCARRAPKGRELGAVYSTWTVLKLGCGSAQPEESAVAADGGTGGGSAKVIKDLLARDLDLTLQRTEEAEARFCDLRSQAAQMNLMLSSSLQNELTQDAYLDMVFAMHRFAADEKDGTRYPGLNGVQAALDYIGMGYQQRCLGTMSALWNSGNPTPTFYRGGIQRVLWAVDFLCYSLMDQCEQEWDGFVVFGMIGDYRRSHLGIMITPYRTMFRPCEWWGLFHEVGHEYFHKLRHSRDLSKWDDWIRDIYDVPDPGTVGRQEYVMYYDWLTWEILSDIFEYSVGFGRDWANYRDVVTRFVLNFIVPWEAEHNVKEGDLGPGTRLRTELEFYVVRWSAVYFHSHPERCESTFDAQAFAEDVHESLHQAAERLNLRSRRKKAMRKEIDDVLAADHLGRVYENHRLDQLLIDSKGRKFLEEVLPRPKVSESDVPALVARLEAGEIVEDVPTPQTVIKSLIAMKQRDNLEELPAKVRMATILSFWNAYAKLLPKRLEQLSRSGRRA